MLLPGKVGRGDDVVGSRNSDGELGCDAYSLGESFFKLALRNPEMLAEKAHGNRCDVP